jgi:hypothetical protein
MLEVRSNVVILAAAKVGGLYGNLMIESNVLIPHGSKGVDKLLFCATKM